MFAILSRFRLPVAAAFVLLTATSACETMAQDEGASKAEIQQLIDDLGSSKFTTRTSAASALRTVGTAAIPALKKALETAGTDKRQRIFSILKRLEQSTFASRLQQLIEHPTVENAARMPEWNRFSKQIGTDRESIDFYVRLLKAESALFAVAFKNPADLRNPLRARAEELMPKNRQPLKIDSFAALMFLASSNDVVLRGATSTDITTMMVEDYSAALKTKAGPLYLKVAGGWILRKNIGVSRPLGFARKHKMQQGSVLARRTLQGTLRPNNDGIEALMLLKDQGTRQDIALIETLFDTANPDYNEQSDRGLIFKGKNSGIRQYTSCHGDLALAVAIEMRGRHPFEFGFSKSDPDGPFPFNEGTTGFESESARQSARKKYFAEFR